MKVKVSRGHVRHNDLNGGVELEHELSVEEARRGVFNEGAVPSEDGRLAQPAAARWALADSGRLMHGKEGRGSP